MVQIQSPVIQLAAGNTYLSLSSLRLVTTTLLGWMPMGTEAPFDLSRWTRSTWITHFLRYTWVTLPSRPLYLPRTIRTSSSLRMGIDRVYVRCVTRLRSLNPPTRGTYVVLRAELLGERRGHDLAPHGGGRGEVRLARLAAGGGDVCRQGGTHVSTLN